jgi:hypothetical protein
MRRHFIFLLTSLSFVPIHTRAQEATPEKKTVIDLDYDSVMDRAHPNPLTNGQVHFHIRVVLSGKNKISQTHDLQSGSLSQQNSTDQALGEDARSGAWHVVSSTRLMHIWNMPQSVRTITVTINPDNTCNMEVRDTLKRGFREYAFQARWTAGLEYYSRYENINPKCEIR